MDNNQFKEAQDKLNKALTDPAFSKLMEHKERILHHLRQPEQTLLEDYYSSLLKLLEDDLLERFMNKDGMDVSNIIRGKIIAIKQILFTKNVFAKLDELKSIVDKAKEGVR